MTNSISNFLFITLTTIFFASCSQDDNYLSNAIQNRDQVIIDSLETYYEAEIQKLRDSINTIISDPTILKGLLLEYEGKNPLDYLEMSYSIGYNFLAAKDVLRIKISNKSTNTPFKDFKCKISFYSETDIILDEQEIIIYKLVNPNELINFKYHVESPSQTAKIHLQIIGASVSFK